MPLPITTEACFTPSQISFFRAYSEYKSHLHQYIKGRPSREGGLRIEEMARNANSLASDSGLNCSIMDHLCKAKNIACFNFDNPTHCSSILPEIVATNEAPYYAHLSKADYARVLDVRIKHANHLNPLNDVIRGLNTFGAFRSPLLFAGGLLDWAILRFKKKISEEEVNACPTFWATAQAAGISRVHFTPGAISKADLYAAEHREGEQCLQRALLEKISAVRESKQIQIQTVPSTRDEQAYRGLVLKHMEDQLMQGLEGDHRALVIQQEYQNKCRDLTAGSAKHFTEHMEYENLLQLRRKELQMQQDYYQLGQNTSEFAQSISMLTGSKSLRQFGQAISGTVQLHKGFGDIASAAASIAAEGIGVANIGTMIGGCTAVVGVAVMCMEFMQEEDPQDGLGETLNVIYGSIQAIWSEMRLSFAETWRMLETMEEHDVQRFCITKSYLEQIITDIARIRHQQEFGFARLHAQLGRMHSELAAGLNDVLDQNCLHAIEEIRQGDAAYLETHYPSVVSRLLTYLVKDSTSEIKTGFMPQPLDTQKIIDALRPSPRMKPLGLLGSVANSFKPDFVTNPANLIGGDSWAQVSKIYEDLIRYRGIHQEAERGRIISEVAIVQSKSREFCLFLQSLVTPASGKPLLDAVIALYAEHLAKALSCVKEVIEQERRRINREKLSNESMSREAIAALENKELLRLDETLEETGRRLTGAATALWQKPILESTTFKYVRRQDTEASTLPTVCSSVFSLTRYPSLRYYSPEVISLGGDRFQSLQSWRSLQLDQGDKQTGFRDAAQTLFSLETNPIINLSFTYGVSKDPGGLWVLSDWVAGNKITAINFIHNIYINAANYPVAVTQFVSGFVAAHYASQLTLSRASINAYGYYRDCQPVTSLTTEAKLMSMVEPGLTSILNIGCQRIPATLSANKSFSNALQQMELSRLFITACLERLGVALTAQQKDLFASEQKIKELLEKLEATPSVNVVKELLFCLDLEKLPIAAEQTPVPATPKLVRLQNAVWGIMPTDITAIPLYQPMHEANEKLARLTDALRTMPVCSPVVVESKHQVQADIAGEMQALREDNRQLKAELAETNAKLQAMQGTMDQLLRMMQQISRAMPAPPPDSSINPPASPRLFQSSGQ